MVRGAKQEVADFVRDRAAEQRADVEMARGEATHVISRPAAASIAVAAASAEARSPGRVVPS